MLYRLYTEDYNKDTVAKLVSSAFPSFTLEHGIGYWNGNPESSLIVDIDTNESRGTVDALAEQIRTANHQSAVLVEAIPSDSHLITERLQAKRIIAEPFLAG